MDEIYNSVDFDVGQYIANKFPAFTMVSAGIDIDEVYNENFGKLSREIHYSNFNDFVDEHFEIKSLVYFLNDEYVNYIKKQFEKNQDRNRTDNSITTLVTPTSDSEPTLSKAVVHPIHPIEKTNQPTQIKPQTRSSIDRSEVTKSKNGKYAERLVRNKLKDIYDTLRWTSENSEIPAERNQSSIYDMEYQRDGKNVYVEVKAAVNNFYMSSAEYHFAHEHAESYEIYLVDLGKEHIDGPHIIYEFEASKTATQYRFAYNMQ
ncbi:protein NO VEIN domain-containing protein [Heyndrickxia sp. NPDC080065]|uniref:protein NO VEIN domain-containing protein n=1 Tax=Heyndrickxia sp. NPDC080065 TaxID=3390568 RepID=UPI003D0562B0